MKMYCCLDLRRIPDGHAILIENRRLLKLHEIEIATTAAELPAWS
jgi:hypothetical protein